METRTERQAKVGARVAELRRQAEAKEAEAARVRGKVNDDHAFWTQPAYGNAAGRAFARQRDHERSRIIKSGEIAAEAKALREKADAMEKRGAVMEGDADAERQAKIASVEVRVGQVVSTVHYGLRKVLKVNAKSVLVEGSFGPLKIEKNFIRAA
jgi:hypothetical protein